MSLMSESAATKYSKHYYQCIEHPLCACIDVMRIVHVASGGIRTLQLVQLTDTLILTS